MSQIITNSDSLIHISSFTNISSNQSISFSRFKLIDQYFIIKNNSFYLAKAKKYIAQAIFIIYLNILITN